MNNSIVVLLYCTLLLLGSVISAAQPVMNDSKNQQLPDPRTPLTFRDSGVYGGWNEYWFREDFPFNILIVQARGTPDNVTSYHGRKKEESLSWGDWLQRARGKNMRVVADFMPYGIKSAANPLDYYKKSLDHFLSSINPDQLFCITLGEESIYWNGQEELLRKMYVYAKEKYDIPVYQWYSPRAKPPGFGWPNLPADGWVTDEYAMNGPAYETFIRSYIIHQLPLLQIVWAAPMMPTFDWRKAGEPSFDWQIAINQKYNIPTAYFLWEGQGNIWGWSEEAGPLSKEVYQRAVEASLRAAHTQQKQRSWDDQPTLEPQSVTYSKNNHIFYEEDYLKGGGLLAKGAVIDGFQNLRWSGGPLELKPREKGKKSAILLYPIYSEFPLSDVEVLVEGKINSKFQGNISLAASTDGRSWSASQSLHSRGTMRVTLPEKKTKRLWVRVTLSGVISHVGDIAASLEKISITGQFDKQGESPIELYALHGKPMWTKMESAPLYYTAEIDGKDRLGIDQVGLNWRGSNGHSNKVSIRQKFTSNIKVNLTKIASINDANKKDLNASNALGISLDGKNVLLHIETSDIARNEELALDVSDNPQFQDIKEFWIHLDMINASGKSAVISNRIKNVKIEAIGSKEDNK